MALAHRGIKTVLCNSDPLTKDRGLEGQRSKVALHLLNVVRADKLREVLGLVNVNFFLAHGKFVSLRYVRNVYSIDVCSYRQGCL